MTIIRANLQRYTDAPKRIDKSLVVSLIVSSLKCEGYSFVRQESKTRRWFKLSDPQVHEKTGHAIRDIIKKGGGPEAQEAQPSQSKQAIKSQLDQPDIVASQILSSALRVSQLVGKSKMDFAALAAGQTLPDAPRNNSREYRRSSMLRLFDELSPEEEPIMPFAISDQPLPIETRTSGTLRTSDMMHVFNALSSPEPNMQAEAEEEPEEEISPQSKRMGSSMRSFGSSSRSFRRSELLTFLDFTEEELMEYDEEKPAPSNDQPIPLDTIPTRLSDTLNSLFKDQEEIFSNLQNVFGSLPEDNEDNDDNQDVNHHQEMEARSSRASEVLGELLKRQEGLFEEFQNFDLEYDTGTN